ncbi:hypothetical protein PMSM_26390 [Paenibacillus macquariensis subsp. macquariensis]|uniref:Uncharacterized protein n=1 Tax=Paenibacillus macquariensis TaxID=948756 RepID=A0ABY1K997_9BACL|nr:hypothetical protein PMSM_26390 [Paenibacillus macquariensis subsp. macquariensis]SIR44820.1 hypothetical protein SAMN05421578_11478 [Paenibacillus macquariensis]
MIKKYLTKFPLWFKIIWSLVVATYIIVILTNQNIFFMIGGVIVLYTANGFRAWKSQRSLAIVSFIFTVVFSYMLYKFLML